MFGWCHAGENTGKAHGPLISSMRRKPPGASALWMWPRVSAPALHAGLSSCHSAQGFALCMQPQGNSQGCKALRQSVHQALGWVLVRCLVRKATLHTGNAEETRRPTSHVVAGVHGVGGQDEVKWATQRGRRLLVDIPRLRGEGCCQQTAHAPSNRVIPQAAAAAQTHIIISLDRHQAVCMP